MAFCLRKIRLGAPRQANASLLTCKVANQLLQNSSQVADNICWGTFSTPAVKAAISHYSHYKKSSQLKSIAECGGLEQQKQQTLVTVPVQHSLGCLSDLYKRDPLAILLHSRLQILDGTCGQFHPNKTITENQAAYLARRARSRISSVSRGRSSPSVKTLSPSINTFHLTSFTVSPHVNFSAASTVTALNITEKGVAATVEINPLQCSTTTEGYNWCKGGGGGGGPDKLSDNKEDPFGLPSPAQLQHVTDVLVETLPKLYTRQPDFSIYDRSIVFENRIRGTITHGLNAYIGQIMVLKTVGHFRFAFVKFDILKISQHPDEGTIKVRWRIRAVKALPAITTLWKAKRIGVSSVTNSDDTSNWYDGYSTFYVRANGLVHRHVADDMMGDENKNLVPKDTIMGRVAVILGLLPKAGHGSATSALALY